jgi:beta-lactamase superfamily II metal-dependent hydrolase
VSVGKDNRFGHPVSEVLERCVEHSLPVLSTDERGTIEFVTDGKKYNRGSTHRCPCCILSNSLGWIWVVKNFQPDS